MGAKTWMLVYGSGDIRESLRFGPALDRDATHKFVQTLFPKDKPTLVGEGNLCFACPPNNEVLAAAFPGVSIIAAKEFGIDYPSKLPERFIAAGGSGDIYLHAMHSVVDWFAFAKWSNGKLVRSLSLSPDSGIMEDMGPKMPFEAPYWDGKHPAVEDEQDEYPFPFHPLELGEAALREFFGYQLEGETDSMIDPESVPLARYKRVPWWKFW